MGCGGWWWWGAETGSEQYGTARRVPTIQLPNLPHLRIHRHADGSPPVQASTDDPTAGPVSLDFEIQTETPPAPPEDCCVPAPSFHRGLDTVRTDRYSHPGCLPTSTGQNNRLIMILTHVLTARSSCASVGFQIGSCTPPRSNTQQIRTPNPEPTKESLDRVYDPIAGFIDGCLTTGQYQHLHPEDPVRKAPKHPVAAVNTYLPHRTHRNESSPSRS